MKRISVLIATALTVAAVLFGSAASASATSVSWPDVGGDHDQNVQCDPYNHQITVSPYAAPMFGFTTGQVVRADVYIRDVNSSSWVSYTGQYGQYSLIALVKPNYIGSAILGNTGGGYDYTYSKKSLGTFWTNGLAGHRYVVGVYYTFYNNARQIMRTDWHQTSSYDSGYIGYSGSMWIPTGSNTTCAI